MRLPGDTCHRQHRNSSAGCYIAGMLIKRTRFTRRVASLSLQPGGQQRNRSERAGWAQVWDASGGCLLLTSSQHHYSAPELLQVGERSPVGSAKSACCPCPLAGLLQVELQTGRVPVHAALSRHALLAYTVNCRLSPQTSSKYPPARLRPQQPAPAAAGSTAAGWPGPDDTPAASRPRASRPRPPPPMPRVGGPAVSGPDRAGLGFTA